MRTASAAGTALEMSASPTEVTKMIHRKKIQNEGLLSISGVVKSCWATLPPSRALATMAALHSAEGFLRMSAPSTRL